MNQPQKLAEELNKEFPNPKLEAIGKFSCCVLTLMWYLGIDESDIDAIMTVASLIDSKVIDNECLVYWFPTFKALTGRELKEVSETPITTIKKIKGKAIVKFQNGSQYHWGGVEKGKVVFDPKGNSKTIAEGKPVLIKVLKF